MGNKLFGFFYKESSTLDKAAYLLGFFALFSQLLAFFRDRLLASIFGAGSALDIYYAAFRIPDFLFVTVASLVSFSVIVPFIVDKEIEGRVSVKKFVDNTFTFFSIIMIGSAFLLYFFIPYLSSFLFKGLDTKALSEVTLLSRILLISPVALGISNLFGSLTQAYNRFAIYAFAPVLYNLGIIFGIIFLSPYFGIYGVAYGVSIGAIMHALVQIPFIFKIGLLPKFILDLDFGSIKRITLLSIPRTLSLSINHIATIFMVGMASLMITGSISIFSFSLNIQSIPLTLIGVSYSLAAFPSLSRYFAEKNMNKFVSNMSLTARHIIFWSLPLTALFIVLRNEIVSVLLGSGNFNINDTRLTAAALAIFSLSAVFQSLILLFTRAFYSAGLTKKPFWINFISTIILMFSTYGFVKLFYESEIFRNFFTTYLKVGDLSGTVVLMLPLGYTFGTILNGVIHYIVFERDFKGFSKEVNRSFFKSLTGSLVVGFVSYLSLDIINKMFSINTLYEVFFSALFSGIIGISFGLINLYALKSEELMNIYHSSISKFRRAKSLQK